mmetsp:Transcript_25262/g.22979  ORF Transcript_25262/g.22979 Transcript_25262/m.22979 type:complete len:444 (+) Transcript_25262:3-1334(+)
MLDRIQANHEAGMKLIKIISKNVDFVQLKLKSSLEAGPDGKLHCSVRDVLAQLPLVINFNLQKQKNMGQKALVPFMISITPKDEGDINIEVYHYSEDLSINRLNEIKSNSKLDFNNISKLAEQSFENIKKTVTTTISTGISITSSMPNWSSTTTHSGNHKPTISSSINSNGLNGFVNTKRGEKMNKALHETINDMPVGNKADTIVQITTSRPHISMIVDKQITLKPGSEIFTFLLGPKEKDWKPFGTETTESINDTTSEDSNINKEKGCPILIQTGPGIKMLMQIPNGEVNIFLPGLVRFIRAHFNDPEALKAHLHISLGSDLFEEQLQIFKSILDRIAKYLLLPGLSFDMNINGKIVALNNEIMISIETPDYNDSEDPLMGSAAKRAVKLSNSPKNVSRSLSFDSKASSEPPCAIKIRVELNLMDLLEDTMAVEETMKHFES